MIVGQSKLKAPYQTAIPEDPSVSEIIAISASLIWFVIGVRHSLRIRGVHWLLWSALGACAGTTAMVLPTPSSLATGAAAASFILFLYSLSQLLGGKGQEAPNH